MFYKNIDFTNVNWVCELIIRIYCVGISISSLEYLYSKNDYKSSGVFSWKVFKLTHKVFKSFLYKKRMDFFFEESSVTLIASLRLISSLILIVLPVSYLTFFLLIILTFTSVYFSFRNIVGNDGSDQMNLIISVTLTISFMSNSVEIRSLGLYFICAQAIISYVIAGFAKLISPKWNNGLALYDIMNTETYGDKLVAHWLRQTHPIVTKLFNWHVILIECLFFLVILLPVPFNLLFIIWGFTFHLLNAIIMGLNGFLWAFLATYPAIIFVNITFQHNNLISDLCSFVSNASLM